MYIPVSVKLFIRVAGCFEALLYKRRIEKKFLPNPDRGLLTVNVYTYLPGMPKGLENYDRIAMLLQKK